MTPVQSNFNRQKHSRRTFISALGALSLTGLLPAHTLAANKKIEFSPIETLNAYIRLMGSLKPATTYTWFSGELWSILPNKTPQPLVSFQGLAKSIWEVIDKNTYLQHSFDSGFFGDLETGEKIKDFVNPMNGRTVQPYPFLYGGGTRQYSIKGVQSRDEIKPLEPKWIRSGDQVWLDEIGSGSFENPIDPNMWPMESAGKQVHYGSSTSYIASAEEVFNPNSNYANYSMSWSSITPWEPWLLMGDTPGFAQWRATGRKLSNFNEASNGILKHVRKAQPNFLDNGRPWEGYKSSWKSFMADRKPATQ